MNGNPEPWLRGTLTHVHAIERALAHALELAAEDVERFCSSLTAAELQASPFGLAPVAFHLRHIARSIDRLLTYAEGRELSEEQRTAIDSELNAKSTKDELFSEFRQALAKAESRVGAFDVSELEAARTVGRKRLPATLAGLLVQVASIRNGTSDKQLRLQRSCSLSVEESRS